VTSFTRLMMAVLSLAPVAVRAAEPPCLAASDAAAIVAYGLPAALEGARKTCQGKLGEDAFLRSAKGAAYIEGFKSAKPALWPKAKPALANLVAVGSSQAAGVIQYLPDPLQQQMVDAMVSGVVAEKFPAERCTVLNRSVALLSPLPPLAMAEAISMVAGLGAQLGERNAGRIRIGKIAICP
jgi:hypothetical protein